MSLVLLTLLLLVFSVACRAAARLVEGLATPVSLLAATPGPCTGEDCLDSCMLRVERTLENIAFDPIENEYYQGEVDLNLVLYPVHGDQLGEATNLWVPDEYIPYQEDIAAHQRVWNFFIDVIPLDLRSMLDRMIIYTDGDGNYAAWVNSTEYGKEGWTIAFDILDSADPFSLTYVLVHEVGHLITLNSAQVTPFDYSLNGPATPAICTQYMSWDGCSNETSYINRFYQAYWKDHREEWKEIDKVKDQAEREALLQEFYQRYRSEFVSDYAATNPQEDIAESWMYFILEAQPTGTEIADRKVLFFYDYPELVEARRKIIDGLCSYAR